MAGARATTRWRRSPSSCRRPPPAPPCGGGAGHLGGLVGVSFRSLPQVAADLAGPGPAGRRSAGRRPGPPPGVLCGPAPRSPPDPRWRPAPPPSGPSPPPSPSSRRSTRARSTPRRRRAAGRGRRRRLPPLPRRRRRSAGPATTSPAVPQPGCSPHGAASPVSAAVAVHLPRRLRRQRGRAARALVAAACRWTPIVGFTGDPDADVGRRRAARRARAGARARPRDRRSPTAARRLPTQLVWAPDPAEEVADRRARGRGRHRAPRPQPVRPERIAVRPPGARPVGRRCCTPPWPGRRGAAPRPAVTTLGPDHARAGCLGRAAGRRRRRVPARRRRRPVAVRPAGRPRHRAHHRCAPSWDRWPARPASARASTQWRQRLARASAPREQPSPRGAGPGLPRRARPIRRTPGGRDSRVAALAGHRRPRRHGSPTALHAAGRAHVGGVVRRGSRDLLDELARPRPPADAPARGLRAGRAVVAGLAAPRRRRAAARPRAAPPGARARARAARPQPRPVRPRRPRRPAGRRRRRRPRPRRGRRRLPTARCRRGGATIRSLPDRVRDRRRRRAGAPRPPARRGAPRPAGRAGLGALGGPARPPGRPAPAARAPAGALVRRRRAPTAPAGMVAGADLAGAAPTSRWFTDVASFEARLAAEARRRRPSSSTSATSSPTTVAGAGAPTGVVAGEHAEPGPWPRGGRAPGGPGASTSGPGEVGPDESPGRSMSTGPGRPPASSGTPRARFRSFLGDVLGVGAIDDPTEAELISPLDEGSLVHEVLERFIGEHVGKPPDEPWSDAERERLLDTIADEVADRYEAEGRTGRRPAVGRARRRRSATSSSGCSTRTSVLRAASRVAPGGGRAAFGDRRGQRRTVAVTAGVVAGRRRTVAFKGIIDRVDRSVDGRRLVGLRLQDRASADSFAKVDDGHRGDGDLTAGARSSSCRSTPSPPGPPTPEAEEVAAHYWFVGRRGPARRRARRSTSGRAGSASVIDVVVDGIEDGTVPRQPGRRELAVRAGGPTTNCRWCEFDRVCPTTRGEAWVQLRTEPELRRYVDLAEGPTEPDDDPVRPATASTSSRSTSDGPARRVEQRPRPQPVRRGRRRHRQDHHPGHAGRPPRSPPAGSRSVRQLAAITFTEAAAAELRDRIRTAPRAGRRSGGAVRPRPTTSGPAAPGGRAASTRRSSPRCTASPSGSSPSTPSPPACRRRSRSTRASPPSSSSSSAGRPSSTSCSPTPTSPTSCELGVTLGLLLPRLGEVARC